MTLIKKLDNGRMMYWCEGCDSHHVVGVKQSLDNGASWQWNGNYEKPTLTPSINSWYEHQGFTMRCHHFVRDGQIQYLSDCTHALAGRTVAMSTCE